MAAAFPLRFWWLCAGSYFFFGSFNMVIPELPELLEPMGEADRKGLVISLFTLTALISRPFSGRLADNIGRVPVMVAGAVVCFCCSLIYPWMSSFAVFVVLRLFHGFSTGFSPTGFSAYIADIVPENRRGEAIGLVTTFGSLGMASSPALGGYLVSRFSHDVMFIASAGFALIAVLIFYRLPESLQERKSFHISHLVIRRQDLFEPTIWLPCILMVLTAYSYGAMLTLLPERSVSIGFVNKGSMFMVFAFASVAVRIFAGRLSDRLGRVRVLASGIIFLVIGLSVCSQSTTPLTLIVGCVFYGLSNGITSPTLFAWATDICPSHHKARAFASLYIALELGIGLGALISGELVAGKFIESGNISGAFLVCAVLGVLALLILHPRLRHRAAVT